MVKALVPKPQPVVPPWEAAVTTYPEVKAIKALACGEATKEQQALVVRWLERVTAVAELEFRPSSDRETAFAGGKRFVGVQFFTLARTTLPEDAARV